MHLNHAKCSFNIQESKLLGFILTKRVIKANLYKFQAIIDTRIPSSVKEVQQLIDSITALARFLSYANEKIFNFFTTLKKNDNFEWTSK